MGDHAVGVRELPGREGVGREALMHQRQRRGEQRMMQIGVIGAELIGQEHALVDQRAAGQRHGVEADVAAAGLAVDGVGDHLAQDVEPALEIVLVLDVGPAADEHLPVGRLGLDHRGRQAGIVGRHVAPAEQLQPFGLDHARDDGFAIDALRAIARHEHVADGVMAGLGQLDVERRGDLFEEFMRDLHQDAGAVAGQRVGAGRAAMGEVLQDLEAMLDDLVARPALEVGDEADAASIVLALRIIESLRRRRRRPRRGSRNARTTHGMPSSHETSATPHAPSERGPEKPWPAAGPSPAKSAERLIAKTQLLRRLPPRSCAAPPDKGQQACPIRPINDRFPGRAQAGIQACRSPAAGVTVI